MEAGNLRRREVIVKYKSLAPLYDRLMSHVEYDQWLALIQRITEKYIDIRSPSILEIGGGTGVLGSMLAKYGFNYTGSDLSFSMCRESQRRNLPVFCADARIMPVKRTFDLIIFLYDGINYLQSAAEYNRAFNEVARILIPGGLFLFDITTEANSMRHFTDYLDFDDYGDYCFVRHSYYNEETTTQHNDFTIFSESSHIPGLYEKSKEKHVQKVFPVKYIEEAIPRSLLGVVGIWDGFTFKKYSSRSERIHFLLRKNSRHDPVLPRHKGI